MSARLLLVRNGLEGAAPWMAQVLQDAGLNVTTISHDELTHAAPADVVLLRIGDHSPVRTCWDLHKRGHRSVIAVSGTPSSVECIRLLNAGADYYLDAWLPKAELVAPSAGRTPHVDVARKTIGADERGSVINLKRR